MLRWLTRASNVRSLLKGTLFGFVGALFYEISVRLLFKISLLHGMFELFHLRGPWSYWGSMILISGLIAGWSVGGAALYGVMLLWKWARPYYAGEK